MPKVTHTATGPNGEKFKRQSASRRYSHVIIGRPCIIDARRQIEARVETDKREYAANLDYVANGFKPAAWMVGKPVQARNGVKPDYRDLAEQHREEGREHGRNWLAGKPDNATNYATQRRLDALRALAESEAKGTFSAFVALGWSGRVDLATARFGEFQPHYTDLRALPVDPA